MPILEKNRFFLLNFRAARAARAQDASIFEKHLDREFLWDILFARRRLNKIKTSYEQLSVTFVAIGVKSENFESPSQNIECN
jgi:hypothetical protein